MQKNQHAQLNKLFNQAIAEKSKNIAPSFVPKPRDDVRQESRRRVLTYDCEQASGHTFRAVCGLTTKFSALIRLLKEDEDLVDPTEPERILAAFKKKEYFKCALALRLALGIRFDVQCAYLIAHQSCGLNSTQSDDEAGASFVGFTGA